MTEFELQNKFANEAFFAGWSQGAEDRQLAGFDPAFSKLSPGTLTIGHAIDQAIREGATEFDFLRGGEPYKYHWGAVDRVNFRRCIGKGQSAHHSLP